MPQRRSPVAKRTPVERLRLARHLAQDLESHPLVASKVGITLTLSFGQQGGEISVSGPDENQLKSLLLDLGPFVRDNEDTHLPAVMTLAVRHLDDPELVHAIESAQHHYRTSIDALRLNVDGQEISGKNAADLWMNAAYFHRDPEKAAELASHGEMGKPLVRHQFLDYIIEMTTMAIWVGSVIAEAEKRGVIRTDPATPAPAHPHPRRGDIAADLGGVSVPPLQLLEFPQPVQGPAGRQG